MKLKNILAVGAMVSVAAQANGVSPPAGAGENDGTRSTTSGTFDNNNRSDTRTFTTPSIPPAGTNGTTTGTFTTPSIPQANGSSGTTTGTFDTRMPNTTPSPSTTQSLPSGANINGTVGGSINATPNLDTNSIRQAQTALNARGFITTSDGILGPNTQTSIVRFQGQNGLPQTGQLDSATLNALGLASVQTQPQ